MGLGRLEGIRKVYLSSRGKHNGRTEQRLSLDKVTVGILVKDIPFWTEEGGRLSISWGLPLHSACLCSGGVFPRHLPAAAQSKTERLLKRGL